jgi:hypothetical protein
MITNNVTLSSAPQPRYEVRFNSTNFEEEVNSSGKTIGLQEVWQELDGGWWLGAHLVRDDTGVYVRKAFARRGLRADGSFEQHISVGTFEVAAIEDSTTAKSSAPKLDTAEVGATKSTVDEYLTAQYGWATKKSG